MLKKSISVMLSVFMILSCIVTVNASIDEVSLDDSVYNLVTSFIGDASTSRGFAWTAVDGYENMVLRYVKKGEKEYTTVVPDVVDKGTHLYYKADVTNLTAGTSYTYQIGNIDTDKWYGPFEFTTKAAQVDSFSFIGVSDPQGTTESDYAYFKADIATAVADEPDTAFIVNLGDLVNNGYNESQWKWHFSALKGYAESIPYMAVVGNHDAYNPTDKDPSCDDMWDALENFSLHFNNPDNGAAAMAKVSADDMTTQWFQDIAEHLEDTFYSFEYGNAHFAVLNTAAEVSLGGTYGADYRKILQIQRDWLKADLESSNAKWKFVLLHMGGYRADTWRTDIGSVEYFGDIIDDNCVDLVLEGHDHIYMRSYPIVGGDIRKFGRDEVNSAFLGTTYTVLGASANKRYSSSSLKGPGEHVYIYQNTPASQPVYCVFNVSDERIEVTAKQLDGTVLDEYSVIKSDLKSLEGTIVDAGTDRVTVKGITGEETVITVMVTYPEVEKVTSFNDIVYINQLQTNSNGVYYFDFGDRKKDVGEYKILMNIQGTVDEYGYMYQPKLYVVEGDTKIDKLSDIKGNEIDAKMEIINTDNGRLYCAQFKDKRLVNLSSVDIDAGMSGGTTISYSGHSNVDEIKLFFWDRTSNEPLIKPVIIK